MGKRLAFDNGRWYRFEDSGDKVQLNSGIAIAWDIGPAVDLIRRYPLGPKSVRRLSRRMTTAGTGTFGTAGSGVRRHPTGRMRRGLLQIVKTRCRRSGTGPR
jgi:hypothetical protein